MKLTLGVDDIGSDFPGVSDPGQDGGSITTLSVDTVIICPFTQISKLGMVAHAITTHSGAGRSGTQGQPQLHEVLGQP